MPVRLDTLFGERVIETKLHCFFENRLFNRNAVITDDDSLSARLARR